MFARNFVDSAAVSFVVTVVVGGIEVNDRQQVRDSSGIAFSSTSDVTRRNYVLCGTLDFRIRHSSKKVRASDKCNFKNFARIETGSEATLLITVLQSSLLLLFR